MNEELATLDATAQAELVRTGEVKPIELVEAAIERTQRINPDLNAVIHPLFDKARAAAASDVPLVGPFAGVPFFVKDAVCHTEGDPYHVGMRFLKEHQYVATHDTELARRFRAAGFVFVGKTNTPELAMSVTTEPLAYGASHNPWNLAHSTGGSSGGSAAAVAAGLVPVAHANDMGGSIRIPASNCGLVGLKPTRARGTLAPDLGEYWGPLTHEHVVTRSLRDSAGVLDAIAGPAAGDPYTAPPPQRPWVAEIGADPGVLRIGILKDSQYTSVHPDCVAAVDETVRLLEQSGHQVEAVDAALLDDVQSGGWLQAGIARELDRWSQTIGVPIGPEDVEPINWMMAEMGRAMTSVQYVEAAERAFLYARKVARPWSEGLDVLLTPTSPVPPPELGWLAPDVEPGQLLQRLGTATCFTMPFDITGQPAMSVPLHWNDAGLPIGVQLVAATAREDVLFQLASQLETQKPWADRRPPTHA